MKRYPGVAVVTGASSGFGLAFARRLRAAGMEVVGVARQKQRLEERAAEIGMEGVVADLSTAEGCEAVARAVGDRPVGMLVHAAGYAKLGHFEGLELDTQRAMIAVNTTALVDLTHRFLPGMLTRKSGAVVVISSISAWLPSPFLGAYGGTKAFVQSFADGLGSEVFGRGIDVLAVCPGPTRTGFQVASDIDMEPKGPLVGDPDVIAGQALAALGKRRTIVMGGQNWLVTFLTRFVPRALITAVSGLVLFRMSKRLQAERRAIEADHTG